MDVTIGIMAYNEGSNIGRLLTRLLGQNTRTAYIREIIVVSSGSTDRTEEIVEGMKSDKVKLVRQKRRLGKVSAINEFLKEAQTEILILCSADVMPEYDAVERLTKPLENSEIGIVAGRPVPRKNSSIIGKVAGLQWLIHHRISSRNVKFGEFIAFRKIFGKIANTAVDEEEIAMLIKSRGFEGVYAKDAVVHNIPPDNIGDFIRQRRRIYCGHLELKKRCKYEISSMDSLLVLEEYLRTIRMNNILIALLAPALEILGRGLGLYDYLTLKNHFIWDIARSTKR